MKVLALDTSSTICSVAVVEKNKVLRERHDTSLKEHSVALMPMIKDTLNDLKITLKDIGLIACGIGPGSFTGIRIGIATVKAFNDAEQIPIIGINSLEAQAYAVIMQKGIKDCKILSMIDARNDNAYFAIYRMHNEHLTVFKNPEATNISEIPKYLNFQEPVYVVGDVPIDRIETYLSAERSKEEAQGKQPATYEAVENVETLAEAIAFAAQNKYELGIHGDSNSVSPMYLRRPQAERNLIGLKDDSIQVYEMGQPEFEIIKNNYKKFPNLWTMEEFTDDQRSSKYYIARQGEEIVGFVSTKKVVDELEIMNLVTREDKRNQGVASNLLSYIIRKEKVKQINLEVSDNNIVAKNLYFEFGFRIVGKRNNYYKGKEDAILMSL